MTYLYVPFESITDLITQFKNLNVSDIPIYSAPKDKDPRSNFVLIQPHSYHGQYGGLMYNSFLERYDPNEYLSSRIDSDISLVWWWSSRPDMIGDIHALSVGERKAVTPFIFEKLILNPFRKPNVGKSSYYGPKAWSMKSRSDSYSDSV